MSKIKSAETIINESHFLAHTMQIFSREQVIELIKAANKQAAGATLEFTGNYLCKIHKANPNINIMPETYKTLINLIEADELKVI